MSVHMLELVERLLQMPAIAADAWARELAVLMTVPTGRTSKGHPYLQEPAWVRFRDWVPHILADGPRTLAATDTVLESAHALAPVEASSLEDAAKVVKQVVFTTAITAPADLWLLRYVLASFQRLGLSRRLLEGDVVRAQRCPPLRAEELQVDLRFLLSRGLLFCAGDGFRIADHEAARSCFAWQPTLDPRLPSSLASAWARVFTASASAEERAALHALLHAPLPARARAAGRFAPDASDVELGFRLLPIVLGLRAAQAVPALLASGRVDEAMVERTGDASLAAALVRTLAWAGVVEDGGELTLVGRRVLERGIGPFGIIEAYHGYLSQLDDILARGRGVVWVARGANVAASQDANRHTFEQANDALDRFCNDTGFSYGVFIEHALGRGEATRQRSLRAVEAGAVLRYVGADLEDAAIDAAIHERDAGRLPQSMLFVRGADIGKPELLIEALRASGLEADGAVMVVGNGFHEVREQTDHRMTAVLAGYASAGIVLLFTEETGLAVEDLLSTAWNTYHAGFKYVHERSGQGLRPAERRASSSFDPVLPASWAECAERAGYVRLEPYSPRGRTAYPYTPASGQNPAISVTHFCVPAALAKRLALTAASTQREGGRT